MAKIKKDDVIDFEACKPDRGSFVKFDGEAQGEIRLVTDASQRDQVMRLMQLPYGATFSVTVERT